jgi:F420-non-reducing hydrogenase iron-sulfur subunit
MDDKRGTVQTPDPVMEKEPVAGFEPVIVGLCCHYCAFAAADLAGSMRLQYPPNIRIVRLPCTGKVDVIHILRAFEDGADGVFVAGCLEGNCHFTKGNIYAKRRVYYAKKLLAQVKIEPERVEMFNLSSSEGPRFAEIARLMTDRIKRLGPSPVGKKAECKE